MGGSRTEVLLLLLTGIVLLLMVAIIGLFLRMEQLQREVLAALRPLRQAPIPSGLSSGTKAEARDRKQEGQGQSQRDCLRFSLSALPGGER